MPAGTSCTKAAACCCMWLVSQQLHCEPVSHGFRLYRELPGYMHPRTLQQRSSQPCLGGLVGSTPAEPCQQWCSCHPLNSKVRQLSLEVLERQLGLGLWQCRLQCCTCIHSATAGVPRLACSISKAVGMYNEFLSGYS
jgi:hypothetical protein